MVQVAHRLMREGGLEAIRLRPILEGAGLSRRAFYRHFESMDHVLLALFKDTMAGAAERLRPLTAQARDAPDKLATMLRIMASNPSSAEDRQYKLAMTKEHTRLAEQYPQELRVATAPLDGLIQEILEEGMREGTVRQVDAEELANTIHLLVSGVVHRNVHLARDDEGWLDTLCDFCVNAVRAKP